VLTLLPQGCAQLPENQGVFPMHTIPLNSLPSLLSTSLTAAETAGRRVSSSFDELIGSAVELASADRAAQSLRYAALDVGDDEDEKQQVSDALSLCEDIKFDMSSALERTLGELSEQERVLNDTRVTLQRIKDSLQVRAHELFPSLDPGPKPGCVCS
jgi:hypothetical protein